jgi:diguanylate cyclase (GGDEF)-like protein
MTMTDDELELAILKQYVKQHKAAGINASVDKCARELDMRNVLENIMGKKAPSLEYDANLWLNRLAPDTSSPSKGFLRRCSKTSLNSTAHKYHARAFTDSGDKNPAPAWDRIRELEEKVSVYKPIPQEKELEQKFQILFSQPQEQKDFNSWLADAKEIGYEIAILFIDIDKFKQLNSKYTETKVDQTILPAAQKLLKRLTQARGGAYRHGGEEFVVILPNHNMEEAARFAEKVRRAFEAEIFKINANEQRLTVSIGVSIWPGHGSTFNDVLAAANGAEHLAKDRGRNTVVLAD